MSDPYYDLGLVDFLMEWLIGIVDELVGAIGTPRGCNPPIDAYYLYLKDMFRNIV